VDNLDIRNNKFNDNPSAISLALTNYAYVFKNTITGGNYGIKISKSYGTSIENNTISKTSKAGIYADKTINNVYYGEGPQYLYIRYNTISNNYGDAIDLENVKSNLYISYNSITNNGKKGIDLENVGNGIIISRNTISKNGGS
jgi:parallel beta-helix repeat protein